MIKLESGQRLLVGGGAAPRLRMHNHRGALLRMIAALVLSAIISERTLATTPGSPAVIDSRQQAEDILARYRQILLVMSSADRSDEQTRGAARMMFYDGVRQRERYSELLTAELRGASPAAGAAGAASLPLVSAFVGFLESGRGLRAADRLAFQEVLDDLAVVLAEPAEASAIREQLKSRVGRLQAEIEQTRREFGEEVGQPGTGFSTGGTPAPRPGWSSYLEGLKRSDRGASRANQATTAFTQFSTQIPAANHFAAMEKAGKAAGEVFGRQLPPKTLVLTFDDGPHARYTDRIASVLQEYGVPAIFFHVGQNVGSVGADGKVQLSKNAEVSRRLLAAGYTLGNHSYSHSLLPKLDQSRLRREIDQTDRLLKAVDPRNGPLFRAPYGARSPSLFLALEAQQLKSVMWNIDSEDWADPIPESIAERVLARVAQQKRGIILFHDIHERSIEALRITLARLTAEGYAFASWDGEGFVVEGRSRPTPKSSAAAP